MKKLKSILCLLLILILTLTCGCNVDLPEETSSPDTSEELTDPVESTTETEETTEIAETTEPSETTECSTEFDPQALLKKYFNGKDDIGGMSYPEVVAALSCNGTPIRDYWPYFIWQPEEGVRIGLNFRWRGDWGSINLEDPEFLKYSFPDDLVVSYSHISQVSEVPSTTEERALQLRERMPLSEAFSILGSEGSELAKNYGLGYEWKLENGKRLIITANTLEMVWVVSRIYILPPWGEDVSPRQFITEPQILQINHKMTYREVVEIFGIEGAYDGISTGGGFCGVLWWTDSGQILRLNFEYPLGTLWYYTPDDYLIVSIRLYPPTQTAEIPISTEDAEQIKPGMTYREVTDLLGAEGIFYRRGNTVWFQWQYGGLASDTEGYDILKVYVDYDPDAEQPDSFDDYLVTRYEVVEG